MRLRHRTTFNLSAYRTAAQRWTGVFLSAKAAIVEPTCRLSERTRDQRCLGPLCRAERTPARDDDSAKPQNVCIIVGRPGIPADPQAQRSSTAVRTNARLVGQRRPPSVTERMVGHSYEGSVAAALAALLGVAGHPALRYGLRQQLPDDGRPRTRSA